MRRYGSDAANRHAHDVIDLDRLFHHERLSVFYVDQIAIETGDGGDTLFDLTLRGKEG